MRKNMKAMFIVSVVFIICVGIFGLVNEKQKSKSNNYSYGSISEGTAKSDETSEVNEKIKEAKEAEQTASSDTNQSNEETSQDEESTSKASFRSAQTDDTSNEDTTLEDDTTSQSLYSSQEQTSEKTEKEQYIERLNSIVTYYDGLWSKTESYSTLDMKDLKNQEYTKWDDELNTIYQLIKKKMPEEEFIALRDEEREWITSRDEQAALAASKYAGGTMESLEYMAVMTELTKVRTYELVDIYFEE